MSTRRVRVLATLVALLVGVGATTAQAQTQDETPPAPARPMIALTFDDGPTRTTPKVLRALARHDVKATFFMQGSNVLRDPLGARQVARQGHVIGNHGWSHSDFTTMTDRTAAQEIRRTNLVIRAATGKTPVLFRYPFGKESEGGNAVIRSDGMWGGVLWHWSRLPGDFECPGAEGVADYIEANAEDQALILLHDGNEASACGDDQLRYLDIVIPRLKAKGYDFGVVSPAYAPSSINQQSWVRVVSPEEAERW